MRNDILFYTPPGTIVDPLGGWSANTATIGVRPLCTRLSFLSWIPAHIKFRISECNTSRASSYYFAQNGNDSTGNGTQGAPWLSLDKAQQVLDATASGNVALYFAEGDVWRGGPSSTVISPAVNSGSSALLFSSPAYTLRAGMLGTLQNSTTGARKLVTITAYNSGTKVVTFSETADAGAYNRFYPNQMLYIDKPQVTVATYRPSGSVNSPGSRAVFTCFAAPYNTSWTLDSGLTYSRNDSSALTGFGWVRPANDNTAYPFRQVGSQTACRVSSGSWYASGTILFVTDANGEALDAGDNGRIEAVYKNYYEAIVVADVDQVYINNISMTGWGAGSPGDLSYAGYGCHLFMTGSNRAVVHNCEALYNGRHSITHTSPTTGGIFTAVGNTVGWLVNDGISIIGYSGKGDQQFICAFNTFVGSTAPSGSAPYAYGDSGLGYYAHTGTGSAAFLLAYKNQFLRGPYQAWGGNFDGVYPWSDLSQCKSFIVGETWPDRQKTYMDQIFPPGYSASIVGGSLPGRFVVVINSELHLNHLGLPAHSDNNIWRTFSPFLINCLVINNFEGKRGTKWNSVFKACSGGSTYGASWDYCRLYYSAVLWRVPEVHSQQGFIGRLIIKNDATRNDPGTGNATGSGKIYACIIGLDQTGPVGNFSPAFNNNPVNMTGNAYLRPWYTDKTAAYSGYDQDPYYVELGNYILGRQVTSQLALPAPVLVEGYTLEYDKDGTPRNSITHRGPWEGLP